MPPLTIQIEKLVEGGRGIGFFENRPVFVPFVLPGEKVLVNVTRRHRQYLEGELLEVLEASPERIPPPCPYFGKCGGCQWQHIRYETQLEAKQTIVAETLKRVGKIETPIVLPPIPSPKIWDWRSRVTFHQDDKGRIGFFEAESQRVVDVDQCLIVEEAVNVQLAGLRSRETERQRKDFELRATEERGFTQVNPGQNENLKRLVKKWAQQIPHDHIVELFCGSGNFTQVLASLAKKIIAVDSDRAAIESARLRLLHSCTSTLLHFECTDALRFFARYQPESPLDLLVLDPPRDGAGPVVEGVLKTGPKNILYISCNPATLARDLRYLKDFAGYSLIQTQPVDMFPMSYHIETLSLIAASK